MIRSRPASLAVLLAFATLAAANTSAAMPSAGNVEIAWVRIVEGLGPSAGAAGIAAAPDGDLYVAGTVEREHGPDEPRPSVFVVRLDAEGQTVWRTVVQTKDEDRASDIATDAAGNVYVSVATLVLPARTPGMKVVSVAPDGQVRWMRHAGRAGYVDGARAIDVRGGHVVVAGDATDRGTDREGLCDYGHGGFVAALTTEGKRLWSTRVIRTRPGVAFTKALAIDRDGDVMVGMREEPCDGAPRGVVTQLDPAGKPVLRFEVPPITDIEAVAFTDNGFFVAGDETDRFEGSHGVVMKASSGGVKWFRRLTAARGTDALGVAGRPRQWVLALGSTGDTDYRQRDAVVLQYNGNGKRNWRLELDGEAGNYAAGAVTLGHAVYVVGTTAGDLEGVPVAARYAVFLVKLADGTG